MIGPADTVEVATLPNASEHSAGIMKRRELILGGLGVALTASASWRFVSTRPQDVIALVVRRRLDYLRIEPEGLRQFASDLAAQHVVSDARLRALAEFAPIYETWALSSGRNELSYLLRHGEDRIVSTYLISSDFFINGSDESREVRYLGLLDGSRPCANPFARSPL
jgi:hypothetical protein